MGVKWTTEKPSVFLRRKENELHSIVIPLIAKAIAREMRDNIQDLTPIGVIWTPQGAEFATQIPSGVLKKSIDMEKKGAWVGMNVYRWVVSTGVEYAPYVEYGTRPHIIRPKTRGGALSFYGGMGGGAQNLAKVVHHPGTRPVYMFMRGVARTRPKAMLIMTTYIRPWAADSVALLRVAQVTA